jgi:hypothetical protein
MQEFNIRIKVDDMQLTERELAAFIIDDWWVQEVVILKNDGFAHLMPDENTRLKKRTQPE